MGLDLVELVVAVEERFEIEIPDTDASELATPRQLIDYLVTCLNANSVASAQCYSQLGFHRVRRAILDLTALPRSLMRPSTPLDVIFPTNERRSLWPKLQQRLSVKTWPILRRPAWLDRMIYYSLCAAFLCLLLFFTAIEIKPGILGFLLAAISTATLATMMFSATTRFANQFVPAGFNLGDLSRIVAAQIPLKDTEELALKGWNREEIATIARALIMEHLGVTNFRDDDRFIEDIGAD